VRSGARIEKLFNNFDQDNDGFISNTEFRALLATVSGCEPPSELGDETSKKKRISLPSTIS